MKVWNYLFLAIGLEVLFRLSGQPGLSAGVLNLIGFTLVDGVIGFNLANSYLYKLVFDNIAGGISIFVGIAAAVITVGFFTKSSVENYIVLAFAMAVFSQFLAIYINVLAILLDAGGVIAGIGALILIPVIVMYLVAVVEFFRGTD